MLVNVSFDEENEALNFVDIIDVPEGIVNGLDEIKNDFLKWIFDKSNNHKYWVTQNEIKKYVSYSTEAFVDWINEFVLKDEKAVIIAVSTKEIDISLPIVYF